MGPAPTYLETAAWQWRIAVEFRTLYEHAHRGWLQAHDPGRIKVDGGRLGGREPGDSQLAALERLKRLRTELGEITFVLIVAIAVDERSWAALARCRRCHPKTVRTWAIEALAALAGLPYDLAPKPAS